MPEQRKILVVAPFSIRPPHFGSSERVYNLVKQLGADGRFRLWVLFTDYAQVTAATRGELAFPNTVTLPLGPSRRWAQALNPNVIWQGLRILRQERPDLVLCAHLWAGAHAWLFHALTRVPFILDDHNAEYVRLQRMQKRAAGLVRSFEKVVCHAAARVLCVSEADQAHLTRLGIAAHKTAIVHNAIDIAQYRPDPETGRRVRQRLGIADTQPLLLFFGKLDYYPNAQALAIIVEEIMPRILTRQPEAQFVVCGYNPPVARYGKVPNLRFMDVVPKIEDYINAADVLIAPLISGGGTKFKIIQTLACGKPVVTTAIGAEGIHATEDWLQVHDDWDSFADCTLAMLAPAKPRSQQHLARFREQYSWDYMTAQVTRVIEAQLDSQ